MEKLEIPEIVKNILTLLDKQAFWLYVIGIFVVFYLLVSLLTWSFIKPLKYLGIPTIIVGILFIIIRFVPNALLTLVDENINFIKGLLPSILKPVLINGLVCLIVGVLMIVGYTLINKNKKEKIDTIKAA